jgi:NADH-quinone oxidoreductase subunit M
MANVGLPGTSGFVGEFLTLLGAFRSNSLGGAAGDHRRTSSACYALWLYARVMFGRWKSPASRP